MANERELGVRITATSTTDAAVQATITSLNVLRAGLARAGQDFNTFTDAQKIALAAQVGVTEAAMRAVGALQQQSTAAQSSVNSARAAAAAVREQAEAIGVLHRTLQQGINTSGGGVTSDRQFKSAAESAKIFASSLSIAAEAEGRLRTQAIETSAVLARQMELMADNRNRQLWQSLTEPSVGGSVGGGGGRGAGRSVAQNEVRHVTAAFDELARGQKGQLIGTIGAALRDAGLSAGILATSFGGFVAIMAGSAVLKGQQTMSMWADSMRAGAEATGMSIQQFSALDGAFQLIGAKAGEGDAAMRHFAEAVAQASSDAGSKAAAAFHGLGISQDEIIAKQGDVGAMFQRTIGAVNEYANSAQKAAAEQELFGRGDEKINLIAADYDKLTQKARELGLTLNDTTAKGLSETGRQLDALEAKASGDFKKGMVAWQPEIRAVLTALGALSDVLGWILEKSARLNSIQFHGIAGAANWVKNQADSAARFLHLPGSDKPQQEQLSPMSMSSLPGLMMPDWMSKSGGEGGKNVGPLANGMAESMKNLSDSLRAGRDSAEVMIQAEKDRANGIKQADEQLFNTWHTAFSNIRVMLDEDKSQDAIRNGAQREQLSGIRQSATSSDLIMNADKSMAGFSALAMGRPQNGAAEAQAQAQAIMAQAQQEITQLLAVGTAATASKDVQVEAGQEVIRVITEATEKVQELAKAASNGLLADSLKKMFSGLDASVDQLADSLTKAFLAPQQELIHAGLTTIHVNMQGEEIREAAQKVFLSLASDFVSSIASGLNQLAAKGLANMLGMSLEPGAGLGGLLGQATGLGGSAAKGAEFGATTASLTSFNAALATATGLLTGHSGAVTLDTTAHGVNSAGLGLNTSILTGNTAATTLGTVATTTDTTATLSNAAAQSAGAAGSGGGGFLGALASIGSIFGFSGGGLVPSAAGGMVVGGMGGAGRGVLSMLHEREMVLPAPLSTGIQNMIRNQNTSNNSSSRSASMTYAPTVNGGGRMGPGEMSRMMAGQASQMMGMARDMVSKGWRG